jgi:thioester reductase-like protein
LQRLNIALQDHGLSLSSPNIYPIFADLSKPNFNLPPSTFGTLRSETTHIIHCAWAVNFTLPVQSFTPQLASLHNLISLSLSTHSPAHLLFISSIGAAITAPSPNQRVTIIPETPVISPSHIPGTGYGRSKLIGERMVETAVSSYNARATVLRVGQVVPSLTEGSQLWNPNESIPLMARSALTTGSLPGTMSAGGTDICSWIPADVLSKAILEIGFDDLNESEAPSLVYNLVHPRMFSWGKDFLPALKDAGMVFEIVDYGTWLQNVRGSEEDVKKNPSRKLLEFWEGQARAAGEMRGEVLFSTVEAERRSETLRNAGSFVENGMVKALVETWREVWSNGIDAQALRTVEGLPIKMG